MSFHLESTPFLNCWNRSFGEHSQPLNNYKDHTVCFWQDIPSILHLYLEFKHLISIYYLGKNENKHFFKNYSVELSQRDQEYWKWKQIDSKVIKTQINTFFLFISTFFPFETLCYPFLVSFQLFSFFWISFQFHSVCNSWTVRRK